MLLVPCTCGAKLRIKDEVAGHRVKCPRCETVIRAPDTAASNASAAPKPSTQKSAIPLTASPLPKPNPANPVTRKSAPTDDVAPLDLLEQLSSGDIVDLQPIPVKPTVPAIELNYAPDPTKTRVRARSRADDDVIQGPRRGFWVDAAFAFLYPIASVTNCINLVVILAIAVLPLFIPIVRIWLLAVHIALFGLLASAYMTTVIDSAAGSDQLGRPSVDDGVYPDLIRPALLYIGTFVVAMLPAALYFVMRRADVLPDSNLLMYIWIAAGAFLWPMMMLIVALDALHLLVRIDLILVSILRTILPYLAIWVLLLAVMLLRLAAQLGVILSREDVTPSAVPGFSPDIVLDVALRVIGTYFALVCMRLVGLYYLHYKQRLAFELE